MLSPREPTGTRPITRFAARVPAHIAVSVLIIAVTAGVALARGVAFDDRDGGPVGDASDELPTPVPLSSATPIPTPLPTPVPTLDFSAVVDTAVSFAGDLLPPGVADALRESVAAFDDSRRSPREPVADEPSASAAAAPPPSEASASGSPAAEPAPLVPPLAPPPAPLPSVAPWPLPTLQPPLPLPSAPPLPTLTLQPLAI